MGSLKILYLHQYFNTPSMSGGTRSYELARRLVAKGHTVEMITSTRESTADSGWQKTNEAGINVHWVPVPYSNRMSFAKRIKAFFSFIFKAMAYARKLDYDVVYATSTPLTIAIPGAFLSRHKKVPMVFEVRDLWPELPIAVGALKNSILIQAAKWLEKFAYRSSEHIVALSPMMKDGVVKQGIPPERVSVITNGADPDAFLVSDDEKEAFLLKHEYLRDKKLVLYGGTFGLINGVSYLVDLAKYALDAEKPVNFLLVGDGMERDIVLKRAQELGVLNKNLFYLSQVEKREMPAVLGVADMAFSLFVDLPEMWANSANKFFDALMSGTPVAINYSGWQAAVIQVNNVGIQLPPDPSLGSFEGLWSVLSDQAWMDQAARNARALAVGEYNHDRLASSLEKILLDVV